ncbi:lysosomal Pro-X carboxypeptidase [Eupeodes corollae]|uniref:lysosomal Pro-X carboxypeptidase n=1 Tax=Eupeodes corollae TaxID=290404 RepID=UPI00248FDA4B|nr:lysosomal Pro-X carboxypeptidase [Eupeodes corollae]
MLKIFGLTLLGSVLILITSASDNAKAKYSWKEKYLDNVPVDHFNYVTDATFSMRYLINDEYSKNDNTTPILFYCGNEGDIELFAQNTGFIWENAQQLSALIIFAEHRYYGKSLPFKNASFDSPQHFGFLTAEQALADYAQLLNEITGGANDRPVIAIGGSYGGMLAAWFRMKYPQTVTGALAASAPIWQFKDLTPCDIFTKIVTSVFKTSLSSNCSDNIKKSWNVLKNFASNDTGRSELNSRFKFCKGQEITKPDDIEEFFDYLEDVYGNLAMANYPYANEFLAPLPAYPVRQFCFYLSQTYDKDKELLEALQSALSVYYNFNGESKCLDYKSAYSPALGGSAWDIQTCNEMVMPMCSKDDGNMFRKKDWDFKAYSDKCFKKFKIRPREDEILIRFGGRHIESYGKIIFSNGLLDPWSGGGVLKTTNDDITIIIIPEGAHHLDLRGAMPEDPISVIEARKREIRIIKSWIADFYSTKLKERRRFRI